MSFPNFYEVTIYLFKIKGKIMAKFNSTTYRTNGLLPNNNGNEQVVVLKEEQQPTIRKTYAQKGSVIAAHY